jgi:Tfp pilus assembly PilM family ATPase
VFRTKYGVGLDFGHHSVKAAIVSPNKRMVLELLETDLLPERAFMEDRWDPGRHA